MATDPMTIAFVVKGMTCAHCRAAVTRVLSAAPGVASAAVDLASGRAVVTGRGLDEVALRRAVEGLGYAVEVAKP